MTTHTDTRLTTDAWKEMARKSRRENWGRAWYKFAHNPLSVVGLVTVGLIIFLAVFAPYVTPYPAHAGPFTDFASAKEPPSLTHFFGTDVAGRDIFSRTIFGFRFSLTMGLVVLSLVARARQAMQPLADHFGLSPEAAAMGVIRLADASMVNAIKLVSVRRGHDPRDFVLVAFGGGGAMHAAALARELRVKKVVIPPGLPCHVDEYGNYQIVTAQGGSHE